MQHFYSHCRIVFHFFTTLHINRKLCGYGIARRLLCRYRAILRSPVCGIFEAYSVSIIIIGLPAFTRIGWFFLFTWRLILAVLVGTSILLRNFFVFILLPHKITA